MDTENCISLAVPHISHPDQTLSDVLQSLLETHTVSTQNTCDRLQQLLDMYPGPIETSFINDDAVPQTSNLGRLEAAIEQYPNINLSERLQEILDSPHINIIQDGGGLNNRRVTVCNAGANAVNQQPSSSITAPPTDTAGSANNTTPSDQPTGTSALPRSDIDTLIRQGGMINGYRVLPRPRFNSIQLRRLMNLKDINSTDLAAYHIFLHNAFDDIVSHARDIGGEACVNNLTLSAPTLKSPVSAVLSDGNNYDTDIFTDQIAKVLQSSNRLMSEDSVEIEANVAMNRRGGGRRKLTDLALDQVIKRKKMSLFCPTNVSNNLCFSICLAHFLNPQLPENELERIAATIHNNAGFSIQKQIGFDNIRAFESLLGIKIVFFYRTNTGGLETYRNHDDPHPKTVCLYLQDSHYYMILNLTAFVGAAYVCEFCYKGYSNHKHHHCKRTCNVCFDGECYNHPKKAVYCGDCLRFCKSGYCYEMHKKKTPPRS
ncbi:uncharacterized protein LOC125254846 [Megalobrama amblycephala]|uniref:uncharacterized protein LOC125254846 n=1 Tax=Megalobrama amblycephala TaxID=75352 RepID=UPI002014187E|nr:uncharacterized protein LOC125254846 [Megalobrama amblycephala]